MTIAALLDHARRSLLDLSTRNRLLSLPRESSAGRIVHVHDELSEELFRLLVREQKSLTLAAGRESAAAEDGAAGGTASELVELPKSDPADVDAEGVAARHRDLKLQTRLTSESLQKRLLTIYYDARTLLEEQGVNILYLALGQLEWFESDSSQLARLAPLILIPVRIDRKTAGSRFSIAWDQDDLTENLSLAERLKELGIKLPSFEYSDDFDPTAYLSQVAKAVEPARRFRVRRHDIVLAFFSFAKFLMYRDLDSATWPESARIDEHGKIKGLLRDGFPHAAPPIPSHTNIDELVPPAKRVHVVDADGSQSLVIAEVDRGSDLVVQGPPGTGKSQTITNLIADAVHAGKKVLFVAEKLAALEVVKRNLERVGLGQIALELHSNKAHKRTVLDELARTLALTLRSSDGISDQSSDLSSHTDALNHHARALHARLGATELSPFNVIGAIAGLRGAHEYDDVVIAQPETWSPTELRAARSALHDLASRVAGIGLPADHPWRGVRLAAVLPNEARAISHKSQRLAAELDGLASAAAEIASVLEQESPATLSAIESLCRLGAELGKLPDVDRSSLASTVWASGLDQVRRIIADGRRHSIVRDELGDAVRADALEREWTADKAAFMQRGQSWLRWFHGDYRSALRQLRLAVAKTVPKSFEERRALFDKLDETHHLQVRLGQQDEFARSAFGSRWSGLASRWDQLEAQINWVAGYKALKMATAQVDLVARVNQPAAMGALAAKLGERLVQRSTELAELVEAVQLEIPVAFGVGRLVDLPLLDLVNRLRSWAEGSESLSPWVNFHAASERVRNGALQVFLAPIVTGSLTTARVESALDQAYFNSLLRFAVRMYPALAQFEGRTHSEIVTRFRQLDRAHLDWIRLQVVRRHLDSLPRVNTGTGALGTLHQEMNKKSRHMALRKLLTRAGTVIQQIKPVFMMSPLSVAQFLAPGAVEFDLLVIDEASQVEPVDVLGAIARCKQIVVVGDDKQLPPTRFFSRMTGNDTAEDDEDEDVGAATVVESILGLCRARGIPDQMLRWHYRSRHHSLIAVSNREFYAEGLVIVPSPENLAAASGLKLRKVPGVYDRGKTRQNAIEAEAIARAVLEFAEHESVRSLGVVAFSEAQKQAILDQLEALRRTRPDLESFFESSKIEPFFVKNLENVQGDERDVILISIGYGRDASGYMTMTFGPLSTAGGERRLNVLISRARWRCEVFSSISADDIDLERAKSRGAAALKIYLKFAETGRLELSQRTEREMESAFEEAVKEKIEASGHTVHTQVGMAGFFIDLAIVDPDQPGRYVLGIECDGAAYHSSRSARDRDRLRQTVLEDHGWRIHRIWSADWLHRPTETLRIVLAAIDRAIADSRDSASAAPKVQQATAIKIDFDTIGEDEAQVVVQAASPGEEYVEARFQVPQSEQIHDLSVDRLANIVKQIVSVEAPIHESEVVQRVRALWGLGRAGSRIQAAVKSAVDFACTQGAVCVEDGAFLISPKHTPMLRNRANTESRSLRQVEMLPPSEIRYAIRKLVELSHRVGSAEVSVPIARWLGFQQTSTQLREKIEKQVDDLVASGALRLDAGQLSVARNDRSTSR